MLRVPNRVQTTRQPAYPYFHPYNLAVRPRLRGRGGNARQEPVSEFEVRGVPFALEWTYTTTTERQTRDT